MYGYRHWVIVAATMTCITTSYGDVINRSTQRSVDPGYDSFFQGDDSYVQPDRREISQGNRRQQHLQHNHYPESLRHTNTPTIVDLPQSDRLHNNPTTTRKQNPYSGKNQNTSSAPNIGNRSNDKRKTQVYADDSRMIYPSDLEDRTSLNASLAFRSRKCFDGLCDEVENYPAEKINRILSRSTELKKFFSTEVIVTTPKVNNRFGEGSEEALCMTQSHTRFPQSAVNVKNVEQLLVNVGDFQQGIVYETCSSRDQPCNFSQDFPQDYVSSCTQKFTVRKLMVVGKESDTPVFDDFKIPSCCVCTVKKT